MPRPRKVRAHLVAGGFPPGEPAAHDIDFVRRQLLRALGEVKGVRATVASDFVDLERWLPQTDFLVTYVAGPVLTDAQCELVESWLEGGGRWLAFHGTSGGKAERVGGDPLVRRMVRLRHHDVLGAFFLNHPPIRRFRVDVAAEHSLTAGLPASFEVADELYLLEVDPQQVQVLLTTEFDKDPSPPGFGFRYERDTSPLADGRTRAVAIERNVGEGAVVYVALGHSHDPASNSQPFVDSSVDPEGRTPKTFRGVWEDEVFGRLLQNGLRWGSAARRVDG